MVELEADDGADLDRLCEQLLANPLIEDYEIELDGRADVTSVRRPAVPRARATSATRVLACERVGEARLVWHGETDLSGIDAVVVPGGFSYGDYLRAGAIARFAPAMEAVARVRRRRRPGARDLQRLPGALRGAAAARRAAAERGPALPLPPGRARGRQHRHRRDGRAASRATRCRSRSST